MPTSHPPPQPNYSIVQKAEQATRDAADEAAKALRRREEETARRDQEARERADAMKRGQHDKR